MLYTVLLFIRAPFYVLLVFVCMCSCLSVVLVKSSLLAKRLARKTPLRNPNHGEGIISIKPRPKSVWLSWFIVFFLCPPAIRDILLTSVARFSLFVLKVLLNAKQTNYDVAITELYSWSELSRRHLSVQLLQTAFLITSFTCIVRCAAVSMLKLYLA